jgi:MFS family permease
MASLSPATLERARKSFFAFNALNSVAFVLLSGSFATLFALRLGASNAFVGFLNALGYITFFFLPLGRRLVRSRPIIGVFGRAWLARYLGMLPVLAAPALAAAGAKGAALGLVLASVALFNLFRGIGLIGNNPLLAFLASGGTEERRDRGSFMVTVQIIGSLGGLGTNLAVSLLLGRSASSWIYAAAMGAGIAVGLLSCALLLRAPEPEGYRPPAERGLWKGSREALAEKPLRDFFIVFLVLSFTAGMARSFLPVYAKEVFSQGDDAVMAYSLIGSLGSLAMGLLTRLLVDRPGAAARGTRDRAATAV